MFSKRRGTRKGTLLFVLQKGENIMDNLDIKPNSHRYKAEQQAAAQEEKKVEKVVTGAVKTKKKNELSKFASIFISEDVKNVKSYVFMDVLVPAIKKAISDIVTDGIDMILYGERGRSKKNSISSKVSYRSYYDRRDDDRRDAPKVQTGYSYDDIILETRGEAEDVLFRMNELIDTYKVASVADLYDLVGIQGNYTDNKYGWTNLRNAEPVRVRDGYMLKLPKVLPID
jgi:hypothetical protein